MNSATLRTVPQIRVFLASPGDVNEERAVALEVLDTLEYDPLFKLLGGVSIHAIAWDKKGSGTAMRATMTPQTAIKEGMPRPSECDIALVLFWGRMGTELPYPEYQKADDSKYRSGTEWEFNDALEAERATGKPITLIYRRTEEPHLDMKDRKQVAQYHAVLDFFDQFSDSETGALKGGVNEYATPEDLRQILLDQLRKIIYNILTAEGYSATGDKPTHRPQVEAAPLWAGSPFPGLRAFTAKDAPIFFGRGAETSELVKRIENSRFTAVVAASGSGKSSLVAAGLIPRLKANAIVSGETGSKDWRFVRFTPGQSENPFAALFAALCETFPEHPVSPFLIEQEKEGFISSIRKNPAALINVCDGLLREAKAPEWAEVLFFVDQFEELFTGIPDERAAERRDFIALLAAIQASRRLRCVVTMRSDFTAKAIDDPTLAGLMNQGNYLLSAPTAGALLEMIKRPAERAGLTWDDGLPEQMQADTGTESGALALLAYALDELYHAAGDAKCLTRSAYAALGGVEGAIGRRAENTFAALALADKELVLGRVFRELVTVDERGTATRQRADQGHFDNAEQRLMQAFVQARLLVTDGGTVEVAHEALFRSWERLKTWIAGAQEDLILLRQVRSAAQEWDKKGRPDFLLWPQERLVLVYAMRERLKPDLNPVEEAFIEPEQARLLREIEILTTDHERRRDIGDRLAVIGDTRHGVGVKEGVPEIDWLPVIPGGEIEIKSKSFTVQPFYIAKYLITYVQYQAFVSAEDGFKNPAWWVEMPEKYQRQELENQRTKMSNAPRDNLSWYQSVAFARWLDAKYRQFGLYEPFGAGDWKVRLPTEWEWQWAAQGGEEKRTHLWGDTWQDGYANTSEAGLSRTTAVGMYPQGAAVCGVLDMAGNLFEWCQNDYKKLEIVDGYSNAESKVLRGGAFDLAQGNAAAAARSYSFPNVRLNNSGVRLVVGLPL